MISFPIQARALLWWKANAVVSSPGSKPQLGVEILVVGGSSWPVHKQVTLALLKNTQIFHLVTFPDPLVEPCELGNLTKFHLEINSGTKL